MPRVFSKTKSTRGKQYTCVKCAKPIVAGERYHEWSFRFGGDRRQHAACGYPKQSQLTQSKMSSVYAAIESAEESINSATTVEDVKSALDTCAEEVRQVADEYREAAEAMGAAGEGSISEERADALNDFADELENVDLPEELTDEDADEHGEFNSDPVEDAREAANDALSNLSI